MSQKTQSLVLVIGDVAVAATTMIDSQGRDIQSKMWVWDAIFVGDCMIEAGARLIVRSDGTANWIARGRSTDSNDTLTASFRFYKQNGDCTFPTGSPFMRCRIFPVAPLNMPSSNTWYDWGSGFGFPAAGYTDMYAASGYFTG
jgi:hypothetical protein